MSRGLHDPRASRAVLVGTHTYDHLADLPAVAENLRTLRTALTDPLVWGLPDEHCTTVEQPGSADDILEAVADAAAAAGDFLVVYFAGHGLLSPADDSLDLALRGSRRDQRFRRLNYETVRAVLREARHIRAKAVILDCCFAGRAIVGAMGEPVELADISRVEGTYLLAAASATEAAVAPPGEKYTAFTGELLDILTHGIDGADAYLDLGSIHDHLCTRLAAKGRPRPQQRNDGYGSRIVLARNRCLPVEAAEPTVAGPLRDLLTAQQRAASRFPYRLYGAPANALATVYVRQQTRAYTSERERGRLDADPGHREEARRAAERTFRPEGPRTPDQRHTDPQTPDRFGDPLSRSPATRQAAVAPLRAVDEALAMHRHLLIVGGPGQGKSTLTLQIAASLAADFRPDDSESAVPLRVTAAKLADLEGPWNTRVERALTDELGPFLHSALPPDVLSFLPPDHARLLIIDGLDEITNPELRRSFIAMLGSRLEDRDVAYRLMITSRPLPRAELEFMNQLALGTYTLEPFSRDQLEEFAGRWFGDTAHGRGRAQAFLHQIARTGVRELSRVPLLATIAAIVFREGAASTLPTSRFRLYEQYFWYLDRDQTARHHEHKAQILGDLVYAHEVHAQSVAYLFAHRRELVEHLADAVVKIREANTEPRDLLRTALAWLDGRGCRPTRLQLPQWPTLVATFLGASGLFVLQGDRLRFVHYTFAEHIAADVRARALPTDFDPDDEAWAALLDEAFDANMQAWAVLVHHSNLHTSGDTVLTWLNAGGTRHQALAGSLLAAGIEADEGHAARFVDHVLHRLGSISLDDVERGQIVRDVAGLVQHAEMRTAVGGYLRDGYRTHDLQIQVAQAIGPEAPDLAIPAMSALLHTADCSGTHKADAARVLAELDPTRTDAIAAVLREIIRAADATLDERQAAAGALGTIDPSSTDEAAMVLTAVISAPEATVSARREAAEALASFGPGHIEAAAAALREVASSESAEAHDVCWAAEALSALGADHASEAAEHLKNAARRSDQTHRQMLAASLAKCGSEHVRDASRIAREISEHPDSTATERHLAALFLASLGETSEAAQVLRAVALDVRIKSDVRRMCALSMAAMDEDLTGDAHDVLTEIATDPDAASYYRARAASSLARLSREYHRTAVAMLRAEVRLTGLPVGHRTDFISALGDLSPSYNDEATRGLHELLEDPRTTLVERCGIAVALASLGTQNSADAAAILRGIIRHEDADLETQFAASADFAALGTAYVAEAAEFLREIAGTDDGRRYVRVRAARLLAQLSPRLVPEAVGALSAITADPHAYSWEVHEAAQEIAGLEMPYSATGLSLLLELVERPNPRIPEIGSMAHRIAALAPHRTASLSSKLAGIIEATETRPSDAALAARALARFDPASTAWCAAALRALSGTVEAQPLERRWIAYCLGGLGPQFRDEAAALSIALIEAADVDPATKWLACTDLDDLGPRFHDQALTYLRGSRSDRTVPLRDMVGLARQLRTLGPDGERESADLLRTLIDEADIPSSLRHMAAEDLARNSPRHGRHGALLLRREAGDQSLPRRRRASAAGHLLNLDQTDREYGAQVLSRLLADATQADERLHIASHLKDAGRRFHGEVADAARGVLVDNNAHVRDRGDAAVLLRQLGAQYRDEACAVLRHIATCASAPVAARVQAASAFSESPVHDAESAELLRAIKEADDRAETAALVGGQLGRLGYLNQHGALYQQEATTLLLDTARDESAPPRVRAKAARLLAEIAPSRSPEAREILREIIASPTTTLRTRRMAAQGLGAFGATYAREGADLLFGMADASGPNTYARRAALRAASRLGLGYAREALSRLDASAVGHSSPAP